MIFWTHAHKSGATLSKPLRTILAMQQNVTHVLSSPNDISLKAYKPSDEMKVNFLTGICQNPLARFNLEKKCLLTI